MSRFFILTILAHVVIVTLTANYVTRPRPTTRRCICHVNMPGQESTYIHTFIHSQDINKLHCHCTFALPPPSLPETFRKVGAVGIRPNVKAAANLTKMVYKTARLPGVKSAVKFLVINKNGRIITTIIN